MCGVWHTSEQIWLRGQIKELDNSDMLYIKYLDYGDTVHLPHSHTRKLRFVTLLFTGCTLKRVLTRIRL